MDIAPRTPVIVGVGQVTMRPDAGTTYASRPTPLDLMTEALERAGADAGAPILDHLDELVAIGSFTWHTADPAQLVLDRLGLSNVRTRLTPTGGNLPQQLVHETARRIEAGEVTTVAITGAEAMYAHALAKREGRKVDWVRQGPDVASPEFVEADRVPFTSEEYASGLTLPIEVYPLFENARRARLGWSIEHQREQLGRLWANFATVAAKNPYAWITEAPSATDIATPSASNRMVSFPYTKLLVANLPVDMGASYVMTSYERARALGVATDTMIFPVAGADANDHWFVSDRDALDQSPAMAAIWAALAGVGANADNLGPIDLYSCFPTVVQTACDVLGIDAFDASRIPTLTGGLTFGGGPGNNYVTHGIAAMVDALRARPDTTGLVTGLGWFATKHAWGTYQARPPKTPFQWANVQPVVDAQPTTVHEQRDGEAVVETYTVAHGRSGPEKLIVAARQAGVRLWAQSADPALMARAESEELIGQSVNVANGVVTF